MKLKFSNYSFFILVCVVLLAFPVKVSGQQHITLINEKGNPVEDAVIAYHPVTLKSFQKVAITNSFGEARIETETKVILNISRIGYVTISDTMDPHTSRTYTFIKNNVNLNDVVITGQFEAETADKSVHRVKIIDRQRIEQLGAVNLKDVLSNEMNIRISQDAVLGTQMSMMGLGGQNVKILIDGVPVIGRLDGNIDISQLNVNNIERIEIIEGPMSVIYGTDALGGVINLITRRPQNKQYKLNINTYYESTGTYNTDLLANYQYKNFQAGISGGRNFFDGFSVNENERERWQQWKPREQYFSDLQLRYRFKSHTHRLLSQYFHETITARNRPVITPYSVTGYDDYFITTRFNNTLYSDFYFRNKASLNLINSFGYFCRTKNSYIKNLVSGAEQLTSNPDDHDTTTFTLITLRGTYTTKTASMFNTQTGYDINLESGQGERLENGTQQQGDYAVFFITDIKATPRLNVRQGIRFVYNTRYGAPVIPSFNAKYDLSAAFSVRVSYAQGFRAPSLKELSLFFVDVNHNIRGNNDLKAETSNNYSGTLTYNKQFKREKYKADVTIFYNDIRDLISLAIVDAANQLYSYVNIDRYRTQGVNINGDVIWPQLRIGGGYSKTGRYNQLSAARNVSDFSYADEYRVNVTISPKKWRTDFCVFYKYNGRLPGYALDENEKLYQTFVDAYSLLDGTITRSFAKNRLQITAGVKNILGITNIGINTSSSAHSASSGNMPVAMGRLLFTSIRINLEKI